MSRMTMTMTKTKTTMTRSPTMTVLWVVLTLCVVGLAAPVYHPRGPQDQPEKPKGRFPSDTGAGKAPRKEPTVNIYDHPNFSDVDLAEGGNQTGDDRGVTSPEQGRPAPDLLLLTTPSPLPATTTTTTTTTTADTALTTPEGTGTPTPEAEVGTTRAGNDTRNREAETAHDGTDVKKTARSQSTKLILVSVLVPVCIVLVIVGVACWMVRARIADGGDLYDGQPAVRGSSAADMLAMSSLIYGGADIDPFSRRYVHT